jgi:hypothetical protein
MKHFFILTSFLMLAINFVSSTEEVSQALVGFHTDTLVITATFTTEEMPEYVEGLGDARSYVVYQLSCPSKKAYQLSHISSESKYFETEKKLYIQKFMKATEKMGLDAEPITYPIQEEAEKGYYSYVTRSSLNNGLTIALYTDFYNVEGHIFVAAQLKLYEQKNKQDLEEEKDLEFFQSVVIRTVNSTNDLTSYGSL